MRNRDLHEEGWYWYRLNDQCRERVIEVYRDNNIWWVSADRVYCDFIGNRIENMDGEFIGPIPKPERW